MRLKSRLIQVAYALLPYLLLSVSLNACAQPKPDLVMLPMSDGVRLATDVYRPAGEDPSPVILMRSTYGRGGGGVEDLLARGYALVVQDVRGRGDSEGEAYVFNADGWRPGLTDGADTVAWIKAQPWCNGKIGTQGGSALAITQMLLAPATTDLLAQCLEVGPASLYHDVVYTGAVFRKCLIEGWLKAIQEPHLIDVYKAHPTYDDFWAFYNVVPKAGQVTAPGLFIGGWYDIFDQGTIDAFLARERDGGEGARGRNYLVMKWSGHGPDNKESEYRYNENRFDLKIGDLRRAFFDYHLKGDELALDGWRKVHYYTMGDDTTPNAPGNEWRTADAWPPFETVPTSFYLHRDGGLETAPPASDDALSFTFDPANPFPTLGGPNLLIPFGPFDQRKVRAGRDDLLIFATAPFEAPIEATGRVSIMLYVSSDAPDTDFTAKLLDIYPEGDAREINILDGVIRVKHRDSLESAAPLLTGPEEVVRVTIDLWSTSWVFNTGHRIGLHVSSSNYPRFEVNPNTGDDFPRDGVPMRPARNTVHMAPGYPSALVLPVRPQTSSG